MSILEDSNRKVVAAFTVVALAAALSCAPRTSRRIPPRRKAPVATDSLNVFFTGSSLGRLKPCGCSGGQLGGLERRPAVFNTVPVEKRMLVDTGSLVETNSDQDLIKFDIIVEALSLLDYHVVNLAEDDFELARNRGLLGHPALRFVSPYGTDDEAAVGFQNRYLLNGEHVTISVLTFDVDKSPLSQIKSGFVPPEEGDKTVNILIVSRCDKDIISSIAALGVVDCIVCPSEAEEPVVIGSKNRRPLVFSVGRYGRYICRLKIEKARVRDRFKFQFTPIKVEEDLEPDPTMVELYKGYQQIVRDSNLLAKHPRYPLDDGLKYVGSESCKGCHEPEYEKWRKTGHGDAYATLEEIGSQFDPECVLCHVVGLDHESGFVSEQETPEMKNVGCENCHGPGSEHVMTPDAVYTAGPKSACIDCHTPEHSGEYAGNERSFRQKIIHWTEPNSPGNVK
ncbi:MAG: multiheme c-type cytochrome [Planctomycetota bacterium]